MSIVEGKDAAAAARRSVGGVFLEGLANRDYARLATALAPNVRFRAMLPPGPQEFEGLDDVTGAFRSWFGEVEEFAGPTGTVRHRRRLARHRTTRLW